MKKKQTTAVIFYIIAGLLNVAYALGSGTSACGDIFLKNGAQLDSVIFEMPNNQDKQVKVKIGGKKHKIETDSINFIVLWHKKHPDMKYVIKPYYCEVVDIDTGENLGVVDYPLWMCCDQAEANASYLHRIGRPDFKKGKIRFNYNALYSYKSTRYVLKKGSGNPCHIPDSTKDKKKWVRVYFKDDPEVIRKLDEGEYDFTDFGYKGVDIRRIVSDYTPTDNHE